MRLNEKKNVKGGAAEVREKRSVKEAKAKLLSKKIIIGDDSEKVSCFADFTNWKPVKMMPFL